MSEKIEDRIVLCDNPKCAVRTVWRSQNMRRGEGNRCLCLKLLKEDPMLAHLDESQDLLDEVLFYFERIDHMLNPEGKIHDLRHRIAKHLGGNR